MAAAASLIPPVVPAALDQRVFLGGLTWKEYEILLAIRGESSVPRMTYLEGVLELMSPSMTHETIRTMISRLVEAYADVRELPLNGIGSWTLKNVLRERGCEPDECYSLGPIGQVPDLAIEVVWTSGGIDKLEIYRGMGVPEVWIWKDGHIGVYRVDNGQYHSATRSLLLPELDLDLLTSFLGEPDQTAAVRAFRAAIA